MSIRRDQPLKIHKFVSKVSKDDYYDGSRIVNTFIDASTYAIQGRSQALVIH